MNVLTAVKDRDAVIREVLSAAKLSHLWTSAGPSAEAIRIREAVTNSDATRTWVLLAFDLFNGTGNLTVNQLFDTLDGRELATCLSLLMRLALGSEGVRSIVGGSDGEPVN
ncbi:MAG: hypothetical protein QM817_40780 [Archangium sp.]